MLRCGVCDCEGVPVCSGVVSVIVRVFLCGPNCWYSCVVQCDFCDCQGVPVWFSVVSVIVRMFLCGPVWCL